MLNLLCVTGKILVCPIDYISPGIHSHAQLTMHHREYIAMPNLLCVTGNIFTFLIIPRHTIVAGYYGFTLDVRVSVRPSVRPSVIRPSVRFSFPDANLSKHQWIFTKLGMCFDIMAIWFGIADGKFRQILTVICPNGGYYSLTFLFTKCHRNFIPILTYDAICDG